MTTAYRKKLIEVALPLKAINEASAKEKSIRHGHPSTLHLWWARRPLAACRAVLFASLVNDPSDDPMYGIDEEIVASESAKLFNLIEELVLWENSNNPRVIDAARSEIARSIAANKVADDDWKNEQVVVTFRKKTATAHDFKHKLATSLLVNAFLAEHAPPVLDPFCGGGSIPLEAQRLGLRAYASDLNPVPVLITKSLIEFPPKFAGRSPVNPEWQNQSEEQKAAIAWQGAHGLAEDVRYYGQWMLHEAEKQIGYLYPKIKVTKEMAKDRPDLTEIVGQDLTVIAWIWTRMVAGPNPAAERCHVPLVSSFILSARGSKKVWVEIVKEKGSTAQWSFRVHTGEIDKDREPQLKLGTKAGKAKDFTCVLTGVPIPRTYIQEEGKSDRLGARLMAVVGEGPHGRVFLSPDVAWEDLALKANTRPEVDETRATFLAGTTPTRAMITGGVCSAYGLRTWGHLFKARQLVALTTFAGLIAEARQKVNDDAIARKRLQTGAETEYADAVATYLAFAVSGLANRASQLCGWDSSRDNVRSVFARQALPMTWDYAEANPFSDATGAFSTAWIERVLVAWFGAERGECRQVDATAAIEWSDTPLVSTDPPYYDNISYAELSDFFYSWLRLSLRSIYPSIFATALTPKSQELIASPYRHDGNRLKAQQFFEQGLAQAFTRMHDVHPTEYPLTVYYAFKQSETGDEGDKGRESHESTQIASTGWETMLAGLIHSGFSVSGTWPMRTELGNRMVSMGANALASSIVLVCRPRSQTARLATRKEFIYTLRQELPEALKNLQHGNIAPVDLAQSAIGPGMAVFTRYSKVVESDGRPMSVRTALGIINQVLDEGLAEQEGDFDSETCWALAWFEQFGTSDGPYGVAETLSKAKNTAVNGLVEAGIVEAKGGKVQLVGRDNVSDDWDPVADQRLTVWETTQHLIRTFEVKGEAEAATLLNRLGGIGETARELAYRLYSICEKKKCAEEALAYNSLVIAWPELTKLALAERNQAAEKQGEMF